MASLLLLGVSALGGCGAMERAAARDPMKCERDPNCGGKRGRTMDCTAQCVDDPACMDRCQAVQSETGVSGR